MVYILELSSLIPVDIGRYRSPAYKVHVIMIAVILPHNMIQCDQCDIEHVHSDLYFINTRCVTNTTRVDY